jgi:hypothetical protein
MTKHYTTTPLTTPLPLSTTSPLSTNKLKRIEPTTKKLHQPYSPTINSYQNQESNTRPGTTLPHALTDKWLKRPNRIHDQDGLDLGCRYELSPPCPEGILLPLIEWKPWRSPVGTSPVVPTGLGFEVVGGCETKSRRRPCRIIPGTGKSFGHRVSQMSAKSWSRPPTTLLQ